MVQEDLAISPCGFYESYFLLLVLVVNFVKLQKNIYKYISIIRITSSICLVIVNNLLIFSKLYFLIAPPSSPFGLCFGFRDKRKKLQKLPAGEII